MNNTFFSNSFVLLQIQFDKYHHTDNRRGAERHYIAYMRNGRCRIETRSQVLSIAQGDVFYIPMGLSYQSYWYGTDQDLICFDSLGFYFFPNCEERQYSLQVIGHGEEELALFDRISQNRQEKSRCIFDFFALLGMLLPKMQYEAADPDTLIILEAERYFRSNPHGGVGEAARHCGVSESGLYALFQRSGYSTPNQLRQKILVEKARELLISTDRPVEEISRQLNFSSASYFRKILKKYTGLTPREIRKRAAF